MYDVPEYMLQYLVVDITGEGASGRRCDRGYAFEAIDTQLDIN